MSKYLSKFLMFIFVLFLIFSCTQKTAYWADTVTVDYVMRLADNNTVIDTSMKDIAIENNIYNPKREYTPLKITLGQGKVIKGFENAIINMSVGEEKTVLIPAKDAYGEYLKSNIGNLNLIKIIAKTDVKGNYSINQVLKLKDTGYEVKIIGENATHYTLKMLIKKGGYIKGNIGGVGRVIDVNDTKATIDFNHPFAGKDLNATITLLSIEK